jgi:hypothetical protein
MVNRRMVSILAVTAIIAASLIVRAQIAQQPAAPAGQPAARVQDLSGVWDIINPPFDPNNPYARPALQFTKEAPSMQPWAEERYKANRKGQGEKRPDQGRADRDPTRYPYCMPPGFPRVYGGGSFEIVQNPTHVLIVLDSSVQRIYTDGRKHPKGPPLTFMGQSIGRYEGDTLVVETKDLYDLTWIDGMGHPHSDALRVEQRIRRVDQGTLEMNFLFDDPKAYTKPWTGKRTYKLRSTKRPTMDYDGDYFPCEDSVREEYSRKVLGEKERDDAWRELRKEGTGY